MKQTLQNIIIILDYYLIKYLGWFLYPQGKLGKEKKNKKITKSIKKSYENIKR